ncbi:hypothetical protein [Pantoea stewartii]|uniref:hypothetical protein n=1 Tax=Pantoea stewartii TaxID=66269 RepID=UPI0019811D7E|nr:hypothetical protein [Pantoea stewartii]
MKTQMEIVLEGIEKLKKMSTDCFRKSLIKAGARVQPGYQPDKPKSGMAQPLPPPKKR